MASDATDLRTRLTHPVIDVDGHHLEFIPALDDHLRESMGDELFTSWKKMEQGHPLTVSERATRRISQPGWWTASATNRPADRAAAALPHLLRARLDEFGIDFMILYTSAGLRTVNDIHDDIRRGFCWSINEFYAEHYLALSNRLTPAAVIPMYTPEEAIAELKHCHDLGFKVVQFPYGVPRPIPYIHERDASIYPLVHWLDTFGVDSAHDYDRVWTQLHDFRYAATFHGHSSGAAAARASRSITNYVFNHIGAHAGLMFDLCKSLVLSGVTYRYPDLAFAFLEGGVHWVNGLLNDFYEHWKKRNIDAIQAHDPRQFDVRVASRLFQKWGGTLTQGRPAMDFQRLFANSRESKFGDSAEPANRDDFAACHIREPTDIIALFSNLYFGCEGDDWLVRGAFQALNPLRVRLNAMFSSDFGHWDAEPPDRLLTVSFELVRLGLLSEHEFQEFTADNAIRLHATLNPSFWEGTVVQDYARKIVLAPRESPGNKSSH